MTVHREQSVKREKTNKMQQLDVYYQHFLNMFRAPLCHLQENKTCVTARGVLRWFCWMWLVVVVGHCLVGCEHCEGYCSTFTVLATYNAAPHIRYQPHPAEPAHYTICSNAGLCSPEDGHNNARNMLRQKLTINIRLLHLLVFFSLHKLQYYSLRKLSLHINLHLRPILYIIKHIFHCL